MKDRVDLSDIIRLLENQQSLLNEQLKQFSEIATKLKSLNTENIQITNKDNTHSESTSKSTNSTFENEKKFQNCENVLKNTDLTSMSNVKTASAILKIKDELQLYSKDFASRITALVFDYIISSSEDHRLKREPVEEFLGPIHELYAKIDLNAVENYLSADKVFFTYKTDAPTLFQDLRLYEQHKDSKKNKDRSEILADEFEESCTLLMHQQDYFEKHCDTTYAPTSLLVRIAENLINDDAAKAAVLATLDIYERYLQQSPNTLGVEKSLLQCLRKIMPQIVTVEDDVNIEALNKEVIAMLIQHPEVLNSLLMSVRFGHNEVFALQKETQKIADPEIGHPILQSKIQELLALNQHTLDLRLSEEEHSTILDIIDERLSVDDATEFVQALQKTNQKLRVLIDTFDRNTLENFDFSQILKMISPKQAKTQSL